MSDEGVDRGRLLLGVTDPVSLLLMKGHPAHLAREGWQVDVVAGAELARVEGADTHVIPMRREPAPLADLVALGRWIILLRNLRPAVVMVGTPKAGLLGIVASWLTRVPRRIYLLRGLRLESASGPLFWVLWSIERVACFLATEVIAISPSLAGRTRELRLADPHKVHVLGGGSSNGVDLSQFRPATPDERRESRRRLGIPDENFVVGFVGRIHADKGIETLLDSLESLDHNGGVSLVIVGGVEDRALAERIETFALTAQLSTVRLGHLTDISHIYWAIDVLCLPSRREGFGNVVLEAAASGLPSVVSNATGCRDAVVNGRTGWIVPVDNTAMLGRAINAARSDLEHTRSLGAAAREWVAAEFDRTKVWSRMDDHLRMNRRKKDGPDDGANPWQPSLHP